ncbi:hypothetical protein HAX54_004852 [Datura stramonium]|uniref:Cytochrome P450 n=1 Tax=Datura stramonium TaxID=4076 RepID=A0ABS8T8G9_DATST|nr:hypothetical protein [Datura stramonium]
MGYGRLVKNPRVRTKGPKRTRSSYLIDRVITESICPSSYLQSVKESLRLHLPTLPMLPHGWCKPSKDYQQDADMKGHDFRLLPFGAGRRICPGTNLAINMVTSMLAHLLLIHFKWSPPLGVKHEDIDMLESPGTVTYMRTPLQVKFYS